MVTPSKKLADTFGRVAKKLRISITDRCNMRCIYCMPANNTEWFEQNNILSYDEIIRIVTILADLGVERIRITGGEPLIRPKIILLIKQLSTIDGIKSISMTTNGLILHSMAADLKDAGLVSINVSLDTFKENRFKAISGVHGLQTVLAGIQAAAAAGLIVKVNAVIIRGWNDDEIVDFAEFARKSGHTVRFIEFMPLDGTSLWEQDLVVSKVEIIQKLASGVNELVPLHNNISEPAKLFSFIDGKGILGFIPSITEPFCSNCDRLRLTSDGRLLTCLYENPGYDLKNLLRRGKSNDDIEKYILECIMRKPEGIISLIRSKSLRPTMNLMYRIGG
ncbi:MAG: GTP 3',8-cyclase MoaA [Nitrososphaeraceae archaeon]